MATRGLGVVPQMISLGTAFFHVRRDRATIGVRSWKSAEVDRGVSQGDHLVRVAVGTARLTRRTPDGANTWPLMRLHID